MLNARGSALLNVLFATTIVGMITLMAASYFKDLEKKSQQDAVRAQATTVKESLLSLLDNDAAWAKIVALNPSLNCLQVDGIPCDPTGPVVLYEADGTLLGGTAATDGFNLNGLYCNTFNAAVGDPSCVFQFVVNVACVGPCGNTSKLPGDLIARAPKLTLTSTFTYSSSDPKLRGQLNNNNVAYNFNFLRGSRSQTLAGFCNSLDGIFNSTTMTCQAVGAAPPAFNCTVAPWGDPHSWFVGFDATGNPICKKDVKVDAGCPPGAAFVGIRADGSWRCGGF